MIISAALLDFFDFSCQWVYSDLLYARRVVFGIDFGDCVDVLLTLRGRWHRGIGPWFNIMLNQ